MTHYEPTWTIHRLGFLPIPLNHLLKLTAIDFVTNIHPKTLRPPSRKVLGVVVLSPDQLSKVFIP
jgi:hypothetical protein